MRTDTIAADGRRPDAGDDKPASKPPCLMCGKRPPKLLRAEYRDRDRVLWTYPNAIKVPVFCSVRCAANWALVWVDATDFGEDDLAVYYDAGAG